MVSTQVFTITIKGRFNWRVNRHEDNTGAFVQAWVLRQPPLLGGTITVSRLTDENWSGKGVAGRFKVTDMKIEAETEGAARVLGRVAIQRFIRNACREPELEFDDSEER